MTGGRGRAARAGCLALLLTAASPLSGPAQEPSAPPEARPQDVESLDAILSAVYDVISGESGEARDWGRFRSLFLPEGRLVPAGPGPDGGPAYTVLGVEDYVERVGPRLERGGFHEEEIGRVAERFGNVAHVFSAYASRRDPADPEPFQRGVNSFQLWHDGERWWIVSILWDWERPGNPIPERYLRP